MIASSRALNTDLERSERKRVGEPYTVVGERGGCRNWSAAAVAAAAADWFAR